MALTGAWYGALSAYREERNVLYAKVVSTWQKEVFLSTKTLSEDRSGSSFPHNPFPAHAENVLEGEAMLCSL